MLGEPIPKRLREEMQSDPMYKTCTRAEMLHDHECMPDPLTGRLIEWEHAMVYAGKKVNKKWAIIPLCWLVHRGGKLDKRINEWIALNRATEEDLAEYPKKAGEWIQKKKWLNKALGEPGEGSEKAPF